MSDSFVTPLDCNPPGSSVHGILQAIILEWVAISFFRGSSRTRIKPASPALFTTELPGKPNERRYGQTIDHKKKVLWSLVIRAMQIQSMRIIITYPFVVVHSPNRVRLFAVPWTAACLASMSLTISQSLPEFMFDELIKHIHLWVHVWWVHWWCCLAISFSDALFSFCPQSFPASGTFPMSLSFASDNQNTGASASASVLPVTVQDWFPLGLTGLISALCKVISRIPWNSKILQLYINIYYLLTTHILYHFCALDK